MNISSLDKQLSQGRPVCLRIGVDLGGNDVKLGATDLTAQKLLLAELVKKPSLTQDGPQRTIGQIIDGIREVLEHVSADWKDVADIAVTVPCPCTHDGLILNVPNLGTPETKHLWEVPFGDLLAAEISKIAKCEIPVFACNDANAAGQDEVFERFGMSSDPRTIVFITTGTGLGGCVISDGGVFFGLGQAGELGHMKIGVPSAYADRFASDPFPQCGCGAKGCVESRASLSGLIRRLGWALTQEGKEFIHHDLENRGQRIDAEVFATLNQLYQENVKQAAYNVRTFADKRQDSFCRWLLDDWAIMLGALFASVAPVLHPDSFIIGGGMTEMSEKARNWFISVVRESYGSVNQQSCFDSEPGNCEIDWSVSRDQGWRGAILMGMRAHQKTQHTSDLSEV
ncbi:ROK family protein [Bythopirellula goksoeyrii]|uniref:N-acetyl-D-glucosamine kinase n=1 Tax=Bythopirellula goksoeyrii TaxID=1400387 RepID=A0A5B9QLH3_9BACT|nr:ROK family protein [Bythopirellula goksoeyrii]QEG34923.1 N-acetyl-D-glucosamine kinase [Bythopirellula goksoeyrii]